MPEGEPLRPGDPRHLGEFRLTSRLGAGGQGVVYRGESSSGEAVAVKLLHARLGGEARARGYFAKELAAAQQVDPFCTARILAADVEGDVPYIVSEYIAGLSLKHTVERQGPHVGASLHRLAVGTASALTAIHQAGIVHRDFKPSNVLLGPDGPRVIDFGVARLLDAQTSFSSPSSGVVGTPAYMAPEQLSGGELTAAVDVFAWAATVVYASCGWPPFGLDSIPVVITRILQEPPDLGALDGRLRELAVQCLAKDPRERPASGDVLMRLHRSDARPITPVPPALPRRPSEHRPAGPPGAHGPPGQTGSYGPTDQAAAHNARAVQAPPPPAARPPVVVVMGDGDASDTSSGGLSVHDTSGIQVRIGPRASGGGSSRASGARAADASARRAARKRADRRHAIVGAGVLVGVVLVAAVALLWSGGGESSGDRGTLQTGGQGRGGGKKGPRTGPVVEVGTTDGSRYRMAGVGGGADPGAAPTVQSSPPTGTTYAYADYVLTNPQQKPVLLDLYAVDVFIKRSLLPAQARGRCMWQNGVPENMCTPPTKPQVLSRLGGGPPASGAGGDQLMPAGASYVVRVNIDVPVDKRLQQGDLKLYIWKQLYMADQLAKEVPFPSA